MIFGKEYVLLCGLVRPHLNESTNDGLYFLDDFLRRVRKDLSNMIELTKTMYFDYLSLFFVGEPHLLHLDGIVLLHVDELVVESQAWCCP